MRLKEHQVTIGLRCGSLRGHKTVVDWTNHLRELIRRSKKA